MKLFKIDNKGSALMIVLILGMVLGTAGYYLYDQLIFSNKMTADQMYKNQLSLHNISIADTVQTILNVVVEDKDNNNVQVELFHKDRNNRQFVVAEKKFFSRYIQNVYESKNYNSSIGTLTFSFKVCNFINTTENDFLFSQTKKAQYVKKCNKGVTITSTAVVAFRGASDIIVDVSSVLPKQGTLKKITISSSFLLKLPPPATDCRDYVEIDEDTNRLVLTGDKLDSQGNRILREQIRDENGNVVREFFGYVTFSGFNIDGYIPYKFLINRYGGANFSTEECVQDANNNTECNGSFTARTYYRSSDTNRFTTYSYASVYMSIPRGQASFWSDPREEQGCNNVYTLTGGGPSCNPVTNPNVVEHISLGNGGWTDNHTFKIKYVRKADGTTVCSVDRTTVSGLTPGLRQTGCFDENTLVEDNLGNKIKIKDLTMGQALKNPVTNEAVRVVRTVAGPESKDLIKIVTDDNNSVLVTQDHPLKTDRGLISADKLEKSDRLFNEKGSIKIKNIEKVPSNNRTVYNFMVSSNKEVDSDKDHYVIANGIVSGDLYLQAKLKYINSLVSK